MMDAPTTYIVCGHMRTGTSMMMRALIAGGLTAAYDRQRDDALSAAGDDDYRPNRSGFFELHPIEYRREGFPRRHFGKLIKVLGYAVGRMVVGNYRVIFMRRNPEEIRQSFEAFFRTDQHPPSVDRYDAWCYDILGILHNRRDVESVEVVNYRSVVSAPSHLFRGLLVRGWPIDYEAAAATIDPDQCRFRLESLTVGI
jgi:hypothetical protein